MKTARTALADIAVVVADLTLILLLNAEADDREARQNMNLTGETK